MHLQYQKSARDKRPQDTVCCSQIMVCAEGAVVNLLGKVALVLSVCLVKVVSADAVMVSLSVNQSIATPELQSSLLFFSDSKPVQFGSGLS